MRRPLALVALLAFAGPALSTIHHWLDVTVDPAAARITVRDTITSSAAAGEVTFVLHAGLQPRLAGGGEPELVERGKGAVPLERHRVRLPAAGTPLVLEYGGTISHPLTERAEGVGRSQGLTAGTIAPEGVFLGAASGWYPQFDRDERVTFEMTVRVPAGWQAVSQGELSDAGGAFTWRETRPQDEIYLIAAPFTRYEQPTPHGTAMAFLREPDPGLAERYLAITGDYLALFSALMGEYPYAKFALVENFWETGYGMPSFTLLGPRVLRLPFIPYSSYPHEIVHNWWGNGVYPDYSDGNWSEGLTAYMADHLLKERGGEGATYRRDALQKYAEYVSAARDFPLSEFRSRHSDASQAIGYGKGTMLFHMLRLELGDATFLDGLRRFYREHRFTFAGFTELRTAFEAVSKRDLGGFFAQWLTRTGAPRLELGETAFAPGGLTFTLHQRQVGAPYRLEVPLAIRLADGRLVERRVTMERGEQAIAISDLPDAAVCLAVDPRFDLFRRLLPGELPVSLDTLLGAEKLLLVLPSRASGAMREAYRQLAQAWAEEARVQVRYDAELTQLPSDRPVLLLGWENRFRAALASALGTQAALDDEGATLADERAPRAGHSLVLTAARSDAPPLGWLAADAPAPVAGLARKVPHYGKYGYLAFAGDAPDIRIKGQWPVTGSPLVRTAVPGAQCMPPPREPLARLANEGEGGR